MQKILMYDVIMRTTFTPAPDIADRLYEMARKSKKSLNEVVNELIRKGLSNGELVVREKRKAYKVRTFSLGLYPGIDPERLSEIDQEMADMELFRRNDPA